MCVAFLTLAWEVQVSDHTLVLPPGIHSLRGQWLASEATQRTRDFHAQTWVLVLIHLLSSPGHCPSKPAFSSVK